MSATPAPPAPAVDLTKLMARVERATKIHVSADAPATPAGAYGSAIVTSGTRPLGQATEDVLVVIDGSARTAFPQSAVLLALAYGVIPREIVKAVWAAADAATK